MPRPSAGRAFNGGINVAFINVESYNMISQQRPEPTPRHTVFAFLVSSLFNFLDLRYQGNGTASPFQTHRKTMWVAVSSSILYCFAYAAELEPRFAQLGRAGMGLFGTILSVSLASVLFRNSVSFVLYSLCILFLNREMLCSVIEVFWSWIRAKMVVPIIPVTPASTNRGGADSQCKKQASSPTTPVVGHTNGKSGGLLSDRKETRDNLNPLI